MYLLQNRPLYIFQKTKKSHSTEADLVFLGGRQHVLPDGPDDGDVSAPGDVAVGLDNVSESQAAGHSLQNLLHIAEGQTGLRPGASLHQLHCTRDQRNLARAENRLIDLKEGAYKKNRAMLGWFCANVLTVERPN